MGMSNYDTAKLSTLLYINIFRETILANKELKVADYASYIIFRAL